MKDGAAVFIKRVVRNASETDVQQYLLSDGRQDDPSNHTCPVLDVFRDPEDEEYEFLVLPVLRIFDDPPFDAVDDVFEFVKQTLEVRRSWKKP